MSSNYSLKLVSPNHIDIIKVLHVIGNSVKKFNDRRGEVRSLDLRDLNEIFAIVKVSEPYYITDENGLLQTNSNRIIRQLNVMTNMLDNSFLMNDDKFNYKEDMKSVHILTSTRINDGLDVIEFFKHLTNELNIFLDDKTLVSFYRDESKDSNNYNLIKGDIKHVTYNKEE